MKQKEIESAKLRQEEIWQLLSAAHSIAETTTAAADAAAKWLSIQDGILHTYGNKGNEISALLYESIRNAVIVAQNLLRAIDRSVEK